MLQIKIMTKTSTVNTSLIVEILPIQTITQVNNVGNTTPSRMQIPQTNIAKIKRKLGIKTGTVEIKDNFSKHGKIRNKSIIIARNSELRIGVCKHYPNVELASLQEPGYTKPRMDQLLS